MVYKTILKGFAIGIILSLLFHFFGRNIFSQDFLIFIATPGAIVLFKITGWSLHQESGIMLLWLSLMISPPIYGIIIGAVIGLIKKWRIN